MTLTPEQAEEIKKARDFLQHHPEAVEKLLKHVTDAARPVAKKNLETFLDAHKEPDQIKKELDSVRANLSEEVIHELDYIREIIAVRAHFYFGKLTADEAEELKQARDYLQHHPEAVEKLVHEVSPAAQAAAKKNLETFLDAHKAPEQIKKELDEAHKHVSAEVLKELDHLRAIILQHAHVYFHKKLTPAEVEELKKARDYLKHHPEAVEKLVHKVAHEAQPFAEKNLKVFLSDKTPEEIKKELDEVRAHVTPEILVELDHLREIIGKHAHEHFGTKNVKH